MWSLAIGFPILVIWVIFIPVFALILLTKYIKKGDDCKVKQYMLILYQGLKPNRYYWEFVNSFRKVLILMSFTLFVTFSITYKIMIATIILLVTFRIQVYLNPYKNEQYNSIEILALLAGTITISSGLIFAVDDEDQESFWNAIILMFVIIFNIVFVLRWAYLFIKTMSEKYKLFKQIITVIQYIFCINQRTKGNITISLLTVVLTIFKHLQNKHHVCHFEVLSIFRKGVETKFE